MTRAQLLNQLVALEWTERDVLLMGCAHDLAVQLFSAQFRGEAKPFLNHLVGVASLVADEGVGVDACAAALLHAAYAQGDFGDSRRGGVTERRRDIVRAAIGPVAERIVVEYTRFRWSSRALDELIGAADRLDPAVRTLVLLRLANELDDHLDISCRHRGISREELAEDRSVEKSIALAAAVGYQQLGRRLRTAVDAEIDAALPAALATGHRQSYTVLPRSTMRWPQPWARALSTRIELAARRVARRVLRRR